MGNRQYGQIAVTTPDEIRGEMHPATDNPLAAMQREVQRLDGEVKRQSSDISRLLARLQTISEMLEDRGQH